MITSYQFLNAWVKAHIKSERGSSLVEYACSGADRGRCIAAVTTLGKSAVDQFSTVGASISMIVEPNKFSLDGLSGPVQGVCFVRFVGGSSAAPDSFYMDERPAVIRLASVVSAISARLVRRNS